MPQRSATLAEWSMMTPRSTEEESSKIFSDRVTSSHAESGHTGDATEGGGLGTKPWQRDEAGFMGRKPLLPVAQLFACRLGASVASSASCLRGDRNLGFYIKSPKFL